MSLISTALPAPSELLNQQLVQSRTVSQWWIKKNMFCSIILLYKVEKGLHSTFTLSKHLQNTILSIFDGIFIWCPNGFHHVCLAPSVPLAPAFRKRRTTSGKRFLKLKRQQKETKVKPKVAQTKLEIYINQSDLYDLYIYIYDLYMIYILAIYDDLCMYYFLYLIVCMIFTLELPGKGG